MRLISITSSAVSTITSNSFRHKKWNQPHDDYKHFFCTWEKTEMKQQQDVHDFKAQHDLTRALLGGPKRPPLYVS